ncbi:carbohydrate ABC transporter permease [Aureibacillus halotolerans]|uniref:Carbohydrate ABC transporter membrane protein 2 (CUT1 family) n=1 Tax=Aureibacillus halotolerans TaxID=1508390 RepID=A0A4R6UAR9_9BACI|nr:carbohydrate ABC transporter permease [Aureibacillus halotolerans]TDQ41999.1 carbohydrate ABC transporter membrane protein 2 (CUT1 family) [Aureibacillus halotolerans]
MSSLQSKILLHTGLLIGVFLSVFPFYWLAVMSTSSSSEILAFPPNLFFGDQLIINVQNVFASINFFQATGNTIFVAVITTVGTLFFCSLAGFTFAKFQFPGKTFLFVSLLATMMIPSQLSFVPQFLIMASIGWVNTFQALIVPGLAGAFGIFWIKQYCEESVPDELMDAGRLDGCGQFRLYYHVALPILRPAMAFLGIFTFVGIWNDYLWPLVVLNDSSKFTLQVMLAQLNGIYNTDYGMVMAGTLLATIPLIALFAIFSRQFISGIADGAIKG